MIEKEGLVGANFVRRHVFSMTGLTTDSNFSPTFFVPIWSSLENPGRIDSSKGLCSNLIS